MDNNNDTEYNYEDTYEYDALNGYNAEDEYECEDEETDDVSNAEKRDEFIYSIVFNNNKIPTQVPMNFRLGTIDEWDLTCSTFNKAEKGLMFATIYIIYDCLVCNNIHPFLEMNQLTDLFNSHVIHD
jgi:hypothetical protein